MAKEVSRGTTLTIDGNILAQVISITGPSRSTETIDVSELGDTDRKFLASINDGGEVSATIHYDTATHADLDQLIQDQVDNDEAVSLAPVSCVITFPSEKSITFNGILTGLAVESMEIGSAVTATVTIKVSGKPTVSGGGGS